MLSSSSAIPIKQHTYQIACIVVIIGRHPPFHLMTRHVAFGRHLNWNAHVGRSMDALILQAPKTDHYSESSVDERLGPSHRGINPKRTRSSRLVPRRRRRRRNVSFSSKWGMDEMDTTGLVETLDTSTHTHIERARERDSRQIGKRKRQ